MGEMSSKYADIIILTSEDPRKEPVEKIMAQIERRDKQKKQKYLRFPTGKRQSKKQLIWQKKNDFVLLTGKSHEKSMNYGRGEIAWDEYKTAKDALKTI